MPSVDDFAKFRTAHRDGMAIRKIARTFHVSRRTVREALASPSPSPTRAPSRLRPPSSGPSPRPSTRSSATTARPRPSSGTPPPSSSAASRTSTAIPAPTPPSDATSPPTGTPHAPRSSRWPIPGTPPRGRLRTHPRQLPRRPTPRPLPGHRLGLLQCPVRPRPAHRTHRGHPPRHGPRPGVLRRRAGKSGGTIQKLSLR